ncbi:MAG: small basic protein [Planctomycetota bacterium]|jgi:small basic protein (TIGR04137 family)
MSLDRSLKTKPAALNQHRNVLTRAERIAHLQKKGVFEPESDSPFSLLKVASRKATTGKKKKADEKETEEATAPAPAS